MWRIFTKCYFFFSLPDCMWVFCISISVIIILTLSHVPSNKCKICTLLLLLLLVSDFFLSHSFCYRFKNSHCNVKRLTDCDFVLSHGYMFQCFVTVFICSGSAELYTKEKRTQESIFIYQLYYVSQLSNRFIFEQWHIHTE